MQPQEGRKVPHVGKHALVGATVGGVLGGLGGYSLHSKGMKKLHDLALIAYGTDHSKELARSLRKARRFSQGKALQRTLSSAVVGSGLGALTGLIRSHLRHKELANSLDKNHCQQVTENE